MQNLIKKHNALLGELTGHETRIAAVKGQGQDMINEGHFAADDINSKLTELNDKWDVLKVGVV